MIFDEGTKLILEGLNCSNIRVVENKETNVYDVLKIAKDIERCIDAIKIEGAKATQLIEAKGETARLYDKSIATRSAALKIEETPVTLIPALAKGDASQLLKEKIIAEETLRAHNKRLSYLEVCMDGLRSIFSKLDNTGT